MSTKAMANAPAANKMLRAVTEIDLTWPVGPESHMSCMVLDGEGMRILDNCSGPVHPPP